MPDHRRPAADDVRGRGRRPAGADAVGRRPLDRRRRRLDRLRRRRRPAARRAAAAPAPIPGRPATAAAATQPTVTDAAFVARHARRGRARRRRRASTSRRARAALAPLARAARRSRVDEVARGILTIADREHGERDPRDHGRAGQRPAAARRWSRSAAPARCSARCSRASSRSREIVVPPYAGNFSAWGLLGADLTQTAARTRITRLSTTRSPRASTACSRSCSPQLDVARARRRRRHTARDRLDMRYVGQEHTLTIAVPRDEGRSRRRSTEIRDAVHARVRPHLRPLDGRGGRDRLGARDAADAAAAPRRGARLHASPRRASPAARVEAYSFTRGERLAVRDRRRARRSAPAGSQGPAIVARGDGDDLPRRRLHGASGRVRLAVPRTDTREADDAVGRADRLPRRDWARRAAPSTPIRSRPR